MSEDSEDLDDILNRIARYIDLVRPMAARVAKAEARVAALEALCQRAAYEEIDAKLRKQLQAAGRGEEIE